MRHFATAERNGSDGAWPRSAESLAFCSRVRWLRRRRWRAPSTWLAALHGAPHGNRTAKRMD
eukprot:scaffold28681_cov129-Isochrysis_galbana.AAC.3